MPNSLKTACMAPIGAASILAAMAASAQTAGVASQPDSAEQLQVVVVTATKRPENVQNVPMTVNTVSAGQVQDFHLYSFQDVQALVPGLQLSESTSRSQTVSLRGIPFNPDSGTNPSVDIYWNETPVTADTAFRTMFDMGQIEVLRGPQGTLRGRSSPAGAILLETRKPDMYDYGGYATESISNQMLRHTEGAVNLPFIPGVLAMRVAAFSHRDEESGVKDLATGMNDYVSNGGYRASIEWVPSDWFNSTLVYQDLHSNQVLHEVAVGNPQGVATPGSWGAVYGEVLTPGARLSIDPVSQMAGEHQRLATLTEHVQIGANELTSITGYTRNTDDVAQGEDNSPGNEILNWADVGLITGGGRQFTQELRLQSTGKRFWDYLFGAYYADFSTESDVALPVVFPGGYGLVSGPIVVGPPNPAFVSQTLVSGPYKTKDIAGFMDHRFHITARDQIEVGVRWLDETVYRGTHGTTGSALMDVSSQVPGFPMNFNFPGGSTVCGHIPGGVYNTANGRCDLVFPIPPQELTIFTVPNSRYEPWTGSASFKHNFTDDVMAYVSYGRSYRSPSPAPATTTLKVQPELLMGAPETSSDIELGMKTTFLDRRLQVDGDLFYQKFDNFLNQANFATSSDPRGGYPIGISGVDTCKSAAACAAATTPGLANGTQYIPFIGNAVIKGAELTVSAVMAKGWTGTLNLSYSDARYNGLTACDDYNNDGVPDQNLAGSAIPGFGSVQPGKNISICRSHLRLSPVNPFQMTLSSAYERAITSRLDGYVRALYQPVLAGGTSAMTTVYPTPFHQMVDLYFGVRAREHGDWDLSIWAKNLLNETAGQTGYPTTGTLVPGGGTGGQAGWPLLSGYGAILTLPPREIGLTVSYEFGP